MDTGCFGGAVSHHCKMCQHDLIQVWLSPCDFKKAKVERGIYFSSKQQKTHDMQLNSSKLIQQRAIICQYSSQFLRTRYEGKKEKKRKIIDFWKINNSILCLLGHCIKENFSLLPLTLVLKYTKSFHFKHFHCNVFCSISHLYMVDFNCTKISQKIVYFTSCA